MFLILILGRPVFFLNFVLGNLHFCIAVCFIFSLYLDLCVPGDGASIR